MELTSIFWLILMITMLAIEAATVNLVTLWFAFGAMAALVASVCKCELWLQIILFAGVTLVTLLPTRKLAKKYFSKRRTQPTNADRVIGQSCIVTEEIDNTAAKGTVSCKGKLWTARTADGEKAAVGSVVQAVAIEGVKLIVETVKETVTL